jgi:hypothetical protein
LECKGLRTDPCGTADVRKNSSNTDMRLPVRHVTAKPVYRATRELKSIKLMKEHRMWDKVECIA